MLYKISGFYAEESKEVFEKCLSWGCHVKKDIKDFLIIDIGDENIDSVMRETKASANYYYNYNLSDLVTKKVRVVSQQHG